MSEQTTTQIYESGEAQDLVGSTADGPGGQTRKDRTKAIAIRTVIANFGVLIALLLLFAFFSIYLGETFASWGNVETIITQQAIMGILALAVMIPLIVGEFDLSIAANLGINAVLSIHFVETGISPFVVLLMAIAVGMLIGVVNSILVRIGVNAFIATLGVMTILGGGNLLVTQGTLLKADSETLTSISHTQILGIDLTVFYFFGLAVILYYLLEWTPVGRYLRATGLGREAARLTGVRTSFWLPAAFIIAGGIAGFAGFLHAATFSSVPPTIGPEYLLPAYAAAFLGATTILRGFFNVWGTVVGVYLLAVGTTGLALAGTPFWVQPVFNGIALIAAVTFAVLVGRQRRASSA